MTREQKGKIEEIFNECEGRKRYESYAYFYPENMCGDRQ